MNHLSLYELSNNYLQALDILTDPEMDFPIEAVNDTLEGLTGELQDKAINVTMFLRNMEATAAAIKAAEEAMETRRKVFENRIKWMKGYIKGGMERTGISKIECPYFRLSIQKNPTAVNVIDEDKIPEKFKEKVTTWKLDKTAVKKAIESGEVVPGAELTNGTRLVIK